MDISGLRNKSITAWLQVDDGIKALCKHLTQSEWEELKASCTTMEIADNGNTTEKFNAEGFRRIVGRHVVQDISGLTDGVDETTGEPLPFAVTPENIDMLMDQWTEFRMAIMSTPLLLRRMVDLQQEQRVKN